jgi:hypothetical protein
MTVEIKQVPMWLLLRGIAHAVANTGSGWHQVACGIVTPNGTLKKRKPARICRECRHALKQGYVTADQLSGANQ